MKNIAHTNNNQVEIVYCFMVVGDLGNRMARFWNKEDAEEYIKVEKYGRIETRSADRVRH